MADGIFYRDVRVPPVIVDQAAITLATTMKALWTTPSTVLPANYWQPGKTVSLTAHLKFVTDGTAGNYVFGMACGVGDAPAVIVGSSSQAGVTAKTFSVIMEGYATCRTIGTAGTLSMWGRAMPDLSGVLSTAQPILFPTAGVTVVSTLDTTLGTSSLNFQAQRSGAGVWTALATNIYMEAMN